MHKATGPPLLRSPLGTRVMGPYLCFSDSNNKPAFVSFQIVEIPVILIHQWDMSNVLLVPLFPFMLLVPPNPPYNITHSNKFFLIYCQTSDSVSPWPVVSVWALFSVDFKIEEQQLGRNLSHSVLFLVTTTSHMSFVHAG